MIKNNKRCNIIFVGIISILTAILLSIIVFSLFVVIVKGIPKIQNVFFIEEIRFSLKLSIITSIISTILCILFALPIAYGLSRFNFKGKKGISMLIDIPIALPQNVAGIALLILFGDTHFGHLLEKFGFNFVFSPKGIVLAQFFVNVPYMIKILKSTISDIDPRMEFISRTLGCSRVSTFLKVTMPLAKNGFIASIVITWARALGAFGAVLMIAGATSMKTETLPVALYLNLSCGEIEMALAIATILIMISIFSLLIFEILGGETYRC